MMRCVALAVGLLSRTARATAPMNQLALPAHRLPCGPCCALVLLVHCKLCGLCCRPVVAHRKAHSSGERAGVAGSLFAVWPMLCAGVAGSL